jgi:hypothetical protein
LLVQWGQHSLWSSLLEFGAVCREEYDQSPGNRIIAAPISEQAIEYANVNAFFARVSAAQVTDFALYAIWALRDTLEDPDPAHPTSANHIHELDAYIPATAVWVLISGRELWARVGGEIKGDWLQWEGEVTEERWKRWIVKLNDIAVREDLLPNTRQLAEKVSMEMKAVMSR